MMHSYNERCPHCNAKAKTIWKLGTTFFCGTSIDFKNKVSQSEDCKKIEAVNSFPMVEL